jgi:phosphoribosylformylglycinamidine synthase I
MKKVGVVRFLGTNCDKDILLAAEEVGRKAEYLWYQDQFDIKNYEALVVPGGFSYGDYLRTGALSAQAPVMRSVREAAKNGTPILGICNGFQILCESKLLPGVLMKNQGMKFIDELETLQMEATDSPWTSKYKSKQKIKLPIAHGEGRFFADESTLKKLRDKNLVIATYTDNPNGSAYDIAGIMNEEKNIAALMPHPERAMHSWMGSHDGRGFFQWL